MPGFFEEATPHVDPLLRKQRGPFRLRRGRRDRIDGPAASSAERPYRSQGAMNPWSILGVVLLVIGGVGVVLPLLPTTPFVLAAAGCFAKSSPRMHAWLLANRVFGPVIVNWEKKQCVSLKVKATALSMMIVAGGASILFFVPPGLPRLAGLALIAAGCVVVMRLKTCPGAESSGAAEEVQQ